MEDNKKTKREAEHQCHECAKFLKKVCINLFPLRVKPTARACKLFIEPVSYDKTYCKGFYWSNRPDPDRAIMMCQIKNKCARYLNGNYPDIEENYYLVEVKECANNGYPHYIRKKK